jgi:hypothetical protein
MLGASDSPFPKGTSKESRRAGPLRQRLRGEPEARLKC